MREVQPRTQVLLAPIIHLLARVHQLHNRLDRPPRLRVAGSALMREVLAGLGAVEVDQARLGMVAPIRLPVEERLGAHLEPVLVKLVVGALILRAVRSEVQLLLVEVFVREDPGDKLGLRGAHPRNVQEHHASVAVGNLLARAAGLVPAAFEVLHLVGLGAHDIVQLVPVAWQTRP